MNEQTSITTKSVPIYIYEIINGMPEAMLKRIRGSPVDVLNRCIKEYDMSRIYYNYLLEQGFDHQEQELIKIERYDLAEELEKDKNKVRQCRNDFITLLIKSNAHMKKWYPKFCHNRLCPICNNHKSYESDINLLKKMLALENLNYGRYGVYHFSPPNPNLEELREFIQKLKQVSTKVFDRKSKEINKFVDGTVRLIAITYNEENQYHPHLHILLHFKQPAITKLQSNKVYALLNKRYLDFMGLNKVESVLTIYESNLVNLVRTAKYLTKYTDQQHIADSVRNMQIPELLSYLDASDGLRTSEPAGIYRKSIKCPYGIEEIKIIHKAYQSIPSQKLYEFKPPR